MSIKNNVTPTVDRGTLALSYPICPLEATLKEQIQEASRGDEKNDQRLFQLFLRKLPQVQQLIQQLMPDHLNAAHLPFGISFLLMTYMEDQIELYQSQLDERDLSIDEKWNEIRLQYMIPSSKLFVKTDGLFPPFAADLAKKLQQVGYAADFEKTVELFLQILRVDHVGIMHLAALFLNKDGSRVKKEGKIVIQIPRASLESSFSILVQQLQRHYRWFVAESKKTVLDLNSKAGDLNKFSTKDLIRDTEQVDADFAKMEENIRENLHALLTLNLNDNGTLIKKLQIVKELVVAIDNKIRESKHSTEFLTRFKGLNIQDPFIRKQMEKKFSDQLDPQLTEEERKEALQKQMRGFDALAEGPARYFALQKRYLVEPLSDLATIMQALIDSNQSFEEGQARGAALPLAKDLAPILPVAQAQASLDSEKVYQELMNEEISSKKTAGGKKRAAQKTGGKQTKKPTEKTAAASKEAAPPAQKEKAASSSTVASTAPQVASGSASPIDRLMPSLLGLFETNPSSKSLRQAIWHLDALKSVQEAYGKTPFLSKDHLNYVNAIAQGAQKVLEQTYRFCLGEKEESAKVHNLKRLHTLLDPSSPPPDVVNTLYFANHWGRYFHIYHNQFTSETTYRIEIPPLLNLLVSAENRPGASLQAWAEEIIQKTCAQTELLLKPLLAAAAPLPPIPEALLQQARVAVPTQPWQEISALLKSFLATNYLSPYHPSALRLKQALSALTMLQASVEKLNAAPHQRALAAWTSWSLFQLQEVVENVLHAIEFFKDTEITLPHELQQLAKKIEVEMGSLSADLHSLSYKPRYPAEYLVEGEGAQLIDDAEALKHHPELQEGFQLPSLPKRLWKLPSKEVSNASLLNRLSKVLDDTAAFLKTTAIPALQMGVS